MLPSAIGGQAQHLQQMGGRPIVPGKNSSTPGSNYEPVNKPGMVGKPPAVNRQAYGVFSSSSNPQGTKSVNTSNGIRNNSTNAAQTATN